MTRKSPIAPSKVFAIVFTIWAFIDVVVLAIWKMHYMTTHDLIVGLTVISGITVNFFYRYEWIIINFYVDVIMFI